MPVINATSQALSVTGHNVAAPVSSAQTDALTIVGRSTTSMHSSVWTSGLSITAYSVNVLFYTDAHPARRYRRVVVANEDRLHTVSVHGGQ